MLNPGEFRRQISIELNAAYGDGLLSEQTLAHRLDLVLSGRLLDPEHNAGIRLTESYAMYPTAAVSGWYIGHPEARYFALGKIDRDQVEDYARRKGLSLQEAQRWLAPSLGYEV